MSAPVGHVEVPRHLKRFVVRQDYERYDAIDQAVWRFVLLQTHSRLAYTAHPAYREGLAATGISVDRIPRIDEMNERLGRFGWGAVCVDGFIPPRAFQEFQSLGILPVAADIRTRAHLVYTPAPDIIHEAAGHAPILPDPAYSSYLRRIGEVGRKAFTLPAEARIDRAIRALSEIKEDPNAPPGAVRLAETELEVAVAAVPSPSEAARISRLYWWTAEYGLVGQVDDYRLYGAGLLSSLGESVSCHEANVRKLPLDERCIDVAYDITRPQPQLFVARDFEALHDVLERVTRTLAASAGGEVALERAIRSEEPATIHFTSGASVTGVLRAAGPHPASAAWLEIAGPVSAAWSDRRVDVASISARASCPVVLTGPLEHGRSLDRADDAALDALADSTEHRHHVRFASGARVDGRLAVASRRADGGLAYLVLEDASVVAPGMAPRHLPCFVLVAAGDVVTAHASTLTVDAGTANEEDDDPEAPRNRVSHAPLARTMSRHELLLLALYERAERAHERGAPGIVRHYPAIHRAIAASFPDEWLLRWNMLESLLKVNGSRALTDSLRAELEQLEVQFDYRQPIASGLRYLEKRVA